MGIKWRPWVTPQDEEIEVFVAPSEVDVSRILLEEHRTHEMLSGEPDLERLSKQEFADLYTCYRALVRSTLDRGETDPEEDAKDLARYTAETVEFGRAAAANARAKLIEMGYPAQCVDLVPYSAPPPVKASPASAVPALKYAAADPSVPTYRG